MRKFKPGQIVKINKDLCKGTLPRDGKKGVYGVVYEEEPLTEELVTVVFCRTENDLGPIVIILKEEDLDLF